MQSSTGYQSHDASGIIRASSLNVVEDLEACRIKGTCGSCGGQRKEENKSKSTTEAKKCEQQDRHTNGGECQPREKTGTATSKHI